MATTDLAEAANGAYPGMSRKMMAGLWLGLTALLVPAMLFVAATEREVSRYSTMTFEAEARAAIESGKFGRAVRICTGAMDTGLSRSDYWGKARLLRSKAHDGAGDTAAALDDLRACARLWSVAYYNASPEDQEEVKAHGRQLGLKLLEGGDVEGARGALSAGGVGSGNPVEYLYELAATLDDGTRQRLWPEGLCITLEDFEGEDAPVFALWAEEQGRELVSSGVGVPPGSTHGNAAAISLGQSERDGRSWFKLPIYIPLLERRFALRALVKEEAPSGVSVNLGYWYDLARTSAGTVDTAHEDVDGGWKLFDIERDFHAERMAHAKLAGFDPTGGIISGFGLSVEPGPANQYWVDEIQLYIPQ